MRALRRNHSDGASVAEIARELRIPVDSVRVSLRRTLSRLARDKVLAEFGEERPEIFRRGPRTDRERARVADVADVANLTDDDNEIAIVERSKISALAAIFDPDVDEAAACEKIFEIYVRNSGPRGGADSGGAP